MKQATEYQKNQFGTPKNKPKGFKKVIKPSVRRCKICGKDPYPNYFYCPICHHKVIARTEGEELFEQKFN
ncbi:hypothetical protein C6A37_06710 [Desulfobacteraceae bacterium SEEP-SAG9]|nr:hypothetical protein C6A37_06710 [Desulfobacteraceae bacterium SEEP-SAG9]